MSTAHNASTEGTGRDRVDVTRVRAVFFITDALSWFFFDGQPAYFREHGIQVHAVSSPGPQQEEFGRLNNIPVYSVPIERTISPFSDVVSVWRLYKLLRRLRPHILCAHFSKPGIIGMVAGTLARTPIRIYYNHGMALSSARGYMWALLWSVEKLSCLLAHRVIYVAPSVLAEAERLGVCGPGKGCAILSANGLDSTNRFTRRLYGTEYRDHWRASLQIPEDAFVVGFVGRIFKVKGIDDLIRAWQLLSRQEPHLHLLLVGDVDDRLPISPWAQHIISSDARIHLTGFVQEIASVYPAMDALVLPSYHEGLGYCLVEAAAMELPVIATRIPGAVDAVLEGTNGILIEPGHPDQIAEAILKYLRDPALAKAYGKAGREFVVRRFQPAGVWASILRIYDQLLFDRLRIKRTSANRNRVETAPNELF
jgi:glycosyltransferase involved in cell wall biosynthesis